MNSLRLSSGTPLPLGAIVVPEGVNFSVFSRNGTRVVLDLFKNYSDNKPYDSIELDPAENRTGDIWHICIKNLKPGSLYLYRVDGPHSPSKGHRFDFTLPLIDPCAKALTKGSVFKAFKKKNGKPFVSVSEFPKCVVVDDEAFDWEGDKPLNYPAENTIIYETHLKGFTASESSKVKHRGTYQGFIEKLPYLKKLGVTSVELLPVFEFDENENTNKNPRDGEQLVNFWGYSTIGFYAPKNSYAASEKPGACVSEFKELVKSMHREGLEIILDVVFNHTAEGNENGLSFCFRGFDNSIYYITGEKDHAVYYDYSGCGNTVNASHPILREYIVSCLRYWVSQMHVDGFRFDLAAALARGQNGVLLNPAPLIDLIAEDPVLRKTRIIAEPWDAAGGYMLGAFPGRWSEWNDRYRDDVRRFIRGDEHVSTAAATRISGSSDIYEQTGRSPCNSVNYICCHDGFTMNDLVSYNHKHNEQNGENNRDGSDNNLSYNYGYEGETVNPKIESMRLCQIKNFMLVLLVSQGNPMLCAGDEFRRTQHGNNNAYCQDNGISWVDWTFAEKNRNLLTFTTRLIQLRRKHPVFRRNSFFTAKSSANTADPGIMWYDYNGMVPDWQKLNRFLAFGLSGKGLLLADGSPENDFYVAVNTDVHDLTVILPALTAEKRWIRVIDTSVSGKDAALSEGSEGVLSSQTRYVLEANAAVVLMSKGLAG
ncbi:MAG: glycogen debranching protein GlgX [Treponema sp.]|jgi:glycogen operon protein|nr:glycogen debranching protein GlgX [Treponema sp.]